MSSPYAANRARSQQARAATRRCLEAVPGIDVIEHPDDSGLLITLGRGGIVVVDGRAWSGEVVLDDARLVVSGRDRSDVLARLSDRLDTVRRRVRGVDVRGALVLDRPDAPRLDAGDVVVLGIDDLRRSLAARPPLLSDAQVATARAALADGEAGTGAALDAEDDAPPANIDRWVQVVYLCSAGGRLLSLHDRGGRRLGEQQRDGAVAVLAPEHDALVRAVLRAATPSGLQLLPAALPKVPVEIAGGRLMGRLGGLYKVTLIGHRWRKGRTDRLYGTFATPTEGVTPLGYVDLLTGALHPSGAEPVAKDRRAPADYLRRLHQDLPTL